MEAAALAALVGAAGALASSIATALQWTAARRQRERTFEDRVSELTGALSQAGHVVAELEEEIRSRQRLVARLRDEQKLLELSQDEVDAVALTIRGELQTQGRKALWLNIAQSTFFFILGGALTVLFS